ncbi:Zn(2)-C6 fungal-type DNA-binding domain profile [Nakaseomyces glabratus]|nr:Zn(2)-C6 fungal-type DNA-binding domain profile [Nakaseomyces glabratus]
MNNTPMPPMNSAGVNMNSAMYALPMPQDNADVAKSSKDAGANMNKNTSNIKNKEKEKEKVKRKRNRVPLSCTICRRRKVKCDKSRPNCTQCVKTGVAHLCHYMEQAWAEEAEKEISKEMELKQLRSKVKQLEETLSRYNSLTDVTSGLHMNTGSPYPHSRDSSSNPTTATTTNNNSNYNTGTFNSPAVHDPKIKTEHNDFANNDSMTDAYMNSIFKKFESDELDLTREFDMLHLKKDYGLIHLGPTHWLAIMKGDPYLKLLWKHIFTMREKLVEWTKMKQMGKVSKCPIDHSKLKQGQPQINNGQYTNVNGNAINPGKCPVKHDSTLSPGISKCPVKHENGTDMNTINNLPMGPTTAVHPGVGVNPPTSGCPVQHGGTSFIPGFIGGHQQANSNVPQMDAKGNSAGIGKCPVTHSVKQENEKSASPTLPEVSQPSFTKKEVMEQLQSSLPPRGIVILFVNKFFETLYQLAPIIDETNFKNQLNIVFPELNIFEGHKAKDKTSRCPFDHSKLSTINITKSSDYCLLGMLLIIMRLVWLQLPANVNILSFSDNSKITMSTDDKLLSGFEIKTELIESLKTRLIEFDEISSVSNANVTISTIQFAIFYRIILLCNTNNAPSGGTLSALKTVNNDNETHQGLLSSIVQMAFSCGLHRDPDNFPQLVTVFPNQSADSSDSGDNKDQSRNSTKGNSKHHKENTIERYKHTWRKLWYYIISLDIQQSFSLGTPRLLRNLKDFSDTKLPSAFKIDYKNDIKELVIVKNFTLIFKLDLCIMAVLNHILNLSIARSLKKKDLDSLIKLLSDLIFGERNVNEVVSELIERNLLSSSELVATNMQENLLFEQSTHPVADDVKDAVLYGLPTLESLYAKNEIPFKDIMLSKNSGYGGESKSENLSRADKVKNTLTYSLLYSRHLTLRLLVYIMNYILFTRYEPLGDSDPDTIIITKYYAQEALDFSVDCFKNSMIFFENINNPIFKSASVLLLPQCLDVCHRSLQYFICLILRVKCGNITGNGGGQCPFFAVKNESGTESENEKEADLNNPGFLNGKDIMSMSTSKIDLDDTDSLLQTLISNISSFYSLTQRLAKSYTLAIRIMKSTGFFMTLLNDQSSKNQMNSFLPPKHPKIPSIASLLRNDGAAFLNADVSQLRRCPVYQDTIGFDVTRNSSFPGPLRTSIDRIGTQLPPLKSYKPITYTSSDVRGCSSRGASRGSSAISSPGVSNLDVPPIKRQRTMENITSIPRPTEKHMGRLNGFDMINNSNGNILDVNNLPVPALNPLSPNGMLFQDLGATPNHTANGTAVGTPNDLENFLMANTNFNGINPSNIVEAFGINKTDPNLGLTNMDFLPIDNLGFDYEPDLNNIFNGETGTLKFDTNETI